MLYGQTYLYLLFRYIRTFKSKKLSSILHKSHSNVAQMLEKGTLWKNLMYNF